MRRSHAANLPGPDRAGLDRRPFLGLTAELGRAACLRLATAMYERALPSLDNLIKNGHHLISNKIVRTTTEMSERRAIPSRRLNSTAARLALPSLCLSDCSSLCLSDYLSICLFVSLSTLHTDFWSWPWEFIKVSSVMNTQLNLCANLPQLALTCLAWTNL